MSKRKPRGFWKIWENYKTEVVLVAEAIGHFPISRELKGMGRVDLMNSSAHYGGLRAAYNRILDECPDLEKKLGGRKPDGFRKLKGPDSKVSLNENNLNHWWMIMWNVDIYYFIGKTL